MTRTSKSAVWPGQAELRELTELRRLDASR
jgi:hypothetical protein